MSAQIELCHKRCKKNDPDGYTFYVSLVSTSSVLYFEINPTLADGDVLIAKDDGAPVNLATLPVVDADFTKRVKVVLSQEETNCDDLTIIFSDAAGNKWCDLTVNIQTSTTLDDIENKVDILQGSVDDVLANQTLMSGAGFATETDSLKIISDHVDLVTAKLPSRNYLSGSTAATGEIVDKTGYVLADGSNDAIIADAVWNALIASYGTVEATFGYILKAIIAEAESSALFTGTPSDAEIASLALYQLGQEAIANFEDGTKRATLCKFFYPIIRDAVLRAYPWNFAIERQTLVEDAEAPLFGFGHRYALPVDPYCLRVLEMEDTDAKFRVEGRYLHTDEGTVKIKYIARITNSGLYDSLFNEAFIARLASTLAYPITRDKALVDRQWAIYEAKLREARTMDGMEGTIEEWEEDDLVKVR